MSKALLSVLFIGALLLSQKQAFAQYTTLDSVFAGRDSTAVMDSLMKEFDSFLDSLAQPKSFFSASAGMGNQTFSVKNNALNTQETTNTQLSLTPGVGYYNKKGLGISVMGFVTQLNNSYHFYQYAVTPSYDYISKKIVAGISYTRYFGKDSATMDASPYDNDWYGYFNIRHKSWRYGIAAGYANGRFVDGIGYPDSVQRFNTILQKLEWVRVHKTVRSVTTIKDFSFSGSLRKDFNWYGLIKDKDNLTLSLTSYLVTGSSAISTNTRINYRLKNITLARFRRVFNTVNGNDFQFQSAALAASITYNVGRFSVQPIWFIDYYFHDTDQKLSQVFSLTFAYEF
jgi:hypothetical protein